MLTTEPTPEMIAQWKRTAEQFRGKLTPNRKSGEDVERYFCEHYCFMQVLSLHFLQVVEDNITQNDFNAAKLPPGQKPRVRTYERDGIMVGIDRVTGFFQVECEDISRSEAIYDDLFVYRGLDSADLENFFLVAEYVRLAGLGKR